MEVYQNTLGLLASREGAEVCEDQVDHSQPSANKTELLCLAVETMARFLHHRRRESLQMLLARTGVVDSLIMLLFDAKVIQLFLSRVELNGRDSLYYCACS